MSRKFVMLQEMETPKKLIIYSQKKSFPYIKGNKTPKKFKERIFRNLVYSESVTYSEHCQKYTIKGLAKIAT